MKQKYYEGMISVKTGERCSICLRDITAYGYALWNVAVYTMCENKHVDSAKSARERHLSLIDRSLMAQTVTNV